MKPVTYEYMNMEESFYTLLLDHFITQNTKLHSRVYNILSDKANEKYSFHSFMDRVLSYRSPYHYLKSHRNVGDVTAKFFEEEFTKLFNKYY